MFKHVNFGKHIWLHTSKIKKKHAHFKISFRDEVFTRLFCLFFIPGWNFIPAFLTEMSSSRDQISSRQKRVNRKRHLTINRDDFIPGRVSSLDEISRVSTLPKSAKEILLHLSFALKSSDQKLSFEKFL